MGSEQRKRFRKKLYDLNPFCPRCNVKMVLPENLTTKGELWENNRKGANPPGRKFNS